VGWKRLLITGDDPRQTALDWPVWFAGTAVFAGVVGVAVGHWLWLVALIPAALALALAYWLWHQPKPPARR
jgi:hypothetical protein